MKLIVLADDYTGALDTGVQFARSHFPTEVILWTDFLERAQKSDNTCSLSEDAFSEGVTVVDTESRHVKQEEAYPRLLGLTRVAWQLGYRIFYKKTDSTLRGPIGAEMQAMLDVLPYGQLHFLPAYPKMGRQTMEGRQYVHGIPLHETAFAADPHNPVRTACIPDLLADQGFRGEVLMAPHAWVPSQEKDVDTDIGTVPHTLPEPMAAGKSIMLHNARAQVDLEIAGEHLASIKALPLTAGCAGFAEVLADLLKKEVPSLSAGTGQPVPAGRQTLLLCGSTSEVSLAQIRNYSVLHSDIVVHTLCAQEKHPRFWQTCCGEKQIRRITDRLEADPLYIIQAVRNRKELDEHMDAETVAAAFGAIADKLLARWPLLNLIVFGGDTVYGIMKALPGATLRPVDEIAPGIVSSVLVRADVSRLMITKAGGFGDPDALHKMMSCIREKDNGTMERDSGTMERDSGTTERGSNA